MPHRDHVKPLKIESVSSGGTQNDKFPKSLNSHEDYAEIRGVIFDNETSTDETVLLERIGDDLSLQDGTAGTVTLAQLAGVRSFVATGYVGTLYPFGMPAGPPLSGVDGIGVEAAFAAGDLARVKVQGQQLLAYRAQADALDNAQILGFAEQDLNMGQAGVFSANPQYKALNFVDDTGAAYIPQITDAGKMVYLSTTTAGKVVATKDKPITGIELAVGVLVEVTGTSQATVAIHLGTPKVL